MQRRAIALGGAHYAECRTISAFIAQVRPVVDRMPNHGEERGTYVGMLLRVHGWLHSLDALGHPTHFQAIAAGARSLLELAVDARLLATGREQWRKLLAWEESAKLKEAERILRFYENRDPPTRFDLEPYQQYVRNHRERIRDMRPEHWPREQRARSHHPPRWTGQSLADDAVRARLGEYHARWSGQLNWSTHGSGLASVRYLNEDEFPAVVALALHLCAEFARAFVGDILKLLNCADAIMDERLRQLDAERQAAHDAEYDAVMQAGSDQPATG